MRPSLHALRAKVTHLRALAAAHRACAEALLASPDPEDRTRGGWMLGWEQDCLSDAVSVERQLAEREVAS